MDVSRDSLIEALYHVQKAADSPEGRDQDWHLKEAEDTLKELINGRA